MALPDFQPPTHLLTHPPSLHTHTETTGTVRGYLLNFGVYYLLHTLVALLAHSRLGWRTGLRYLWRAQQEPVYLLFTFIRAAAIVAMGLPVCMCVCEACTGMQAWVGGWFDGRRDRMMEGMYVWMDVHG